MAYILINEEDLRSIAICLHQHGEEAAKEMARELARKKRCAVITDEKPPSRPAPEEEVRR